MRRGILTQNLLPTVVLIAIALANSSPPAQAADLLTPGNLIVSTYSSSTKLQTLWVVDANTGNKQQLAQLNISNYCNGMTMTKDGYLYIAQDQQFRVLQVNLQTGAYSVVAGTGLVSSNANALKKVGNLRDLEAADDGTLWLLDAQNLYRFNPTTSELIAKFSSDVDTTLQTHNCWGIGMESDGSLLKSYMGYISDGDGGVVRWNPTTGEEHVIAKLNNTSDAVNGGNGHIYALDYFYNHNENVININESNGSMTTLTSGLYLVEGVSKVVLSPGNGIYVNNASLSGSIYRINLSTDSVSTLTSFSESIKGIAVIPVPEPSTLTFVGFSIACLAYTSRRKVKNGTGE